jgi:hypothetical protein
MIGGSCLCGTVAYEITTPLEEMHHCHCSRCRKHHGAAFSTYAQLARTGFRFVRGEDRVRSYRSSQHVARTFCDNCGSNLQFLFDGLPDLVWVAAGSFDDDPQRKPDAHIFATSKAPWHEITDDLPRYEGYVPQG